MAHIPKRTKNFQKILKIHVSLFPYTMNNDLQQTDILIIGGGWAGLSAAIKLVEYGQNVCLVESAKNLGGRAREISYHQYTVDNGTHIMVGAYTKTLSLMKKVSKNNWSESDLLERQPLNLNYKIKSKHEINIPSTLLPTPFNLLFSFILTKGLTPAEKFKILYLSVKIRLNLFPNKDDDKLGGFLKTNKQNSKIITEIWEPLCLAIMNTPVNQASTEIFIKVFKDAFFKSRQASDLLFFKKTLSESFPEPAQQFIQEHNGRVYTNHKALSIKEDSGSYYVYTNKTNFKAKHIIIASTPNVTSNLLDSLSDSPKTKNLISKLQQFNYQPICTVYIQYPEPISCERTMQGFIGTTTQWMFNKELIHKPGFISVIISSQGSHMDMDNPALIKHITCELAELYPHWPQYEDAFVIREKRATFTSSVNINRIRPSNKTAIPNIWLAGDYTNTQYPATLEGAVRSGLQCAEQILLEN